MRAIDIPEISKLSTPEKILFLEDLWEDIVPDAAGFTVPETHKEELDRRLEQHVNFSGELLSLEQIQTRIEKRK